MVNTTDIYKITNQKRYAQLVHLDIIARRTDMVISKSKKRIKEIISSLFR